MSGQPGARSSVNVWLVVAVLLVLAGTGAALFGVFLVGGVGWTLIVAGAVVVAVALTALPT